MGSLSLISVTASSAAVNMSSLGATDYAVWSDLASLAVPSEHMSGGGSTITAAIFGAGAASGFTPDPRTISWTDGTNTPSSSMAGCQLNTTNAVGNGFEVTFPADTTLREARLYAGMYSGVCRVTAIISDGSTGNQVDSTTLTGAAGAIQDNVIVVQYAANSASQTVKIRIELLTDLGSGLATLQAAAWKSAAPAATLNQENYRWRNDDGSETTATWLASELTDITRAVSTATRLRVQLDSTNDYPARAFQLEYKLSTDSLWNALVATPAPQSVSFSTAGTGNWTVPPYVTSALVETWGGSGAGAQVITNAAGGGGGGGAYSAKTVTVTPGGSIGYVVGAAGTTGASPTNGGDTTWNSTDVVAKGGATPAQGATTGGAGGLASSGIGTTKFSGGTGATGAGTAAGGGGSSAGTAANGNNGSGATGGTAPTGGAAGGAGANGTQGNGSPGSAPGGGGGGGLRTSSGTRTGGAGAAGQIRVTWTPAPAMQLSASANIASSAATATTAQLTAPSGKTTSNLTSGLISDDTNPLPAVDIASGNYTELEWCVQAVTGIAANTNVYQFRVTSNGTPIDTYTDTPQMTIGSGGGGGGGLYRHGSPMNGGMRDMTAGLSAAPNASSIGTAHRNSIRVTHTVQPAPALPARPLPHEVRA